MIFLAKEKSSSRQDQLDLQREYHVRSRRSPLRLDRLSPGGRTGPLDPQEAEDAHKAEFYILKLLACTPSAQRETVSSA
jgi:hypothetical protein